MMLMIDHYDSFTQNLVHLFHAAGAADIRVLRSDAFDVDAIDREPPRALVLSPGPGGPDDYPASLALIRRLAGRVPVLGICLGHELIVRAFGGTIIPARRMMHGKTDELLLDGRGCFRALVNPVALVRYHSLVAAEPLPDCLEVSSRSRDGDVMGARHREFPIEGMQFHPESAGSEEGSRMAANFLNYRREPFPAPRILGRLLAGANLDRASAAAFMRETAEGNLSDPQLAGFLCALEAKGATADELAGCVSVLREMRRPFDAGSPTLDIVGVGGDGSGSFNLSSMAALAAAACGARVAKHGNRAASSLCGSADFFAELGYPLDLPPPAARRLLDDTDFTFLFAPVYHSALRFAARARRALAVRTIMNLLGPLANPADAPYMVLGVPDARLLEPMAEAALLLGARRVLSVHGADGLDEISGAAPTRVVLAAAGEALRSFTFDPREAGVSASSREAVRGGTAAENAARARRLMNGQAENGLLDAVCLNAGAGLFAAGLADSIAQGHARARAAFADGSVRAKVDAVLSRARALAAPAPISGKAVVA